MFGKHWRVDHPKDGILVHDFGDEPVPKYFELIPGPPAEEPAPTPEPETVEEPVEEPVVEEPEKPKRGKPKKEA